MAHRLGTHEKTRENLLRRMAARRGYTLRRSRRRDPGAVGYGLYALLREDSGERVNPAPAGSRDPYGWTLDEVEAFLDNGVQRAERQARS